MDRIASYYQRWLAKGKPFRHMCQHLLVGVLGLFLCFFVARQITVINVILMLLFTILLIDLDGLITLNIFRCRYKEIRCQIGRAYKEAGIPGALGVGLQRHKEINSLLLHNIFGLILVLFLFVWSATTKRFGTSFYILGGVLTHFIFDIADDIIQLGHIRNWFWPLGVTPGGWKLDKKARRKPQG